MSARLVTPIVAAASFALLGCDRVSTAPERPGRPSFITNGTVDGGAHPAVVLLVMDVNGTPAFRCSATLIAPKVVLTAGHCAGERSEEHTSELQSRRDLVCRLLLEKKKANIKAK